MCPNEVLIQSWVLHEEGTCCCLPIHMADKLQYITIHSVLLNCVNVDIFEMRVSACS